MSKQEFKLRQDLEALVSFANNFDNLYKQGRRNPNLGNTRLRGQAESLYNLAHRSQIVAQDGNMLTEYNPVEFLRALEFGKSNSLRVLNERLDDRTYSEAKSHFASKLDEEVKIGMYLNMLEEGIMPQALANNAGAKEKETYKALEFAKRTIDFVSELEALADKGDVNGALQEAAMYANETGRELPFDESHLSALTRASKYGAPAARENEKQILRDIANIYRNVAGKIIKDKNLYGLIDKGVADTASGKAIALNAMYAAYHTQMKVNEAKKKEKK